MHSIFRTFENDIIDYHSIISIEVPKVRKM